MTAIGVLINMDNVLKNMDFNTEAKGQVINVARYGMTFNSLVDYQESEAF